MNSKGAYCAVLESSKSKVRSRGDVCYGTLIMKSQTLSGLSSWRQYTRALFIIKNQYEGNASNHGQLVTIINHLSPQQVKCPYCSNTTVSTVTYKNGYLSYITCLLVLLLFGLLMSFLLIPLIMLITKTLVHRCSVCQEEIGGDGNVFHVLGIKDSVVSFKIGELGLIVTKTIVIGITLLILTLAVLAYRVKNIEYSQWQGAHHHDMPVVEINDTWVQYLETCNREKLFSNYTAQRHCGEHYLGKTVQWKGFAIRVEDYQQSLMKYLHHAVSILVRMDPAESEFHPDLLLTADSEIAANLTSKIETLSRGSEFSFTAVISSIGDAQNIRHLHLTNISKEDGFIEIAPHLHSHSRYGDEPHFLNG